ncbi:MAG: glycosyltransferase [Thermoanaerobaculia bacterium]
MPRIAIVLPNLDVGGAQLVMLTIADVLCRRGVEVDIVVGRGGPLRDRVPSASRLIDVHASGAFAMTRGIAGYLRRERPASMLSALDHTNIAALVARRIARVPLRAFASVHSDPEGTGANVSTLRHRLVLALMRVVYPWADGIVAVSNGVADSVVRRTGVPRSRVHVIYNPVVTDDLLRKAAAPVNHRFFGAGAPPVIVAVGRLTPAKDFETLIRAFARVRSQREAKLVILGEGETRKPLENLIAALGLAEDIDLPGYVENPYPFLAAASLVVLSSRWEGFGNVLAEAMACAARIVSTDCPSGPSEILEAGRWGSLVPPADTNALAEAILHNLGQPAPPGSRESAAARFHAETIAEQYLHVLAE